MMISTHKKTLIIYIKKNTHHFNQKKYSSTFSLILHHDNRRLPITSWIRGEYF